MSDDNRDLVEVAVIYSRAEMVCFYSALEDHGISTFVNVFHHGNAEQMVIALGGYSVRVPAFQVDEAVSLIDEIRVGTEPPLPSRSLRRRIWMLVALLSAVGGLQSYALLKTSETPVEWYYAIFGILNVVTYPFPVRMPGDYRSRSGKMMQLR